MDGEYTLRIEGFTPETLPMARMADYLAALADLIGHKQTTHFDRIEEGSARLIAHVDPQDRVKVAERLDQGRGVLEGAVLRAIERIDNYLAEDNTTGQILDGQGAVVIPFPGITRPRPLAFPAFRQDGSIDGEVVSIGGKDATAHAILRDGLVTYSNIEVKKDVAKALGKLLYGPKVRLFGSGRWERHPDGGWKLLSFSVNRYEVLDDASLHEVLDDIRRAPGNDLMTDQGAYDALMALRGGEDDVH